METFFGLSQIEVVMLTLGGVACLGATVLLYIGHQEDEQ